MKIIKNKKDLNNPWNNFAIVAKTVADMDSFMVENAYSWNKYISKTCKFNKRGALLLCPFIVFDHLFNMLLQHYVTWCGVQFCPQGTESANS